MLLLSLSSWVISTKSSIQEWCLNTIWACSHNVMTWICCCLSDFDSEGANVQKSTDFIKSLENWLSFLLCWQISCGLCFPISGENNILFSSCTENMAVFFKLYLSIILSLLKIKCKLSPLYHSNNQLHFFANMRLFFVVNTI
jgi:hypothetical protein